MMSFESINAEWDDLSKEYNKLEVGFFGNLFLCSNVPFTTNFHVFFLFVCFIFKDVSNEYHEMLEKLQQLQQKCMKDISHQRYRISQISSNLKK